MSKPQWATPDLQSLVDIFYDDALSLGKFTERDDDEMPESYRKLLAHSAHMTVTLEEFHKSKLDVHVHNKSVNGRHYARKISLTRQSDGKTVLFGIVRLTSSFLDDDVRQEIESEEIPLGRVLIKHNVLRNVKLLSLWEIEPAAELLEIFQLDQAKHIFGRTALIYCDSIPAVELLEIVAV